MSSGGELCGTICLIFIFMVTWLTEAETLPLEKNLVSFNKKHFEKIFY